jgi:hypothetical protein
MAAKVMAIMAAKEDFQQFWNHSLREESRSQFLKTKTKGDSREIYLRNYASKSYLKNSKNKKNKNSQNCQLSNSNSTIGYFLTYELLDNVYRMI